MKGTADEDLPHLQHLGRLQQLAQALIELRCLHHLDISHNRLYDAGVHALALNLPQLPDLQCLNMKGCAMSNHGSHKLAKHISGCINLSTFLCGFNEGCVRLLCSLVFCSRLQVVSLPIERLTPCKILMYTFRASLQICLHCWFNALGSCLT